LTPVPIIVNLPTLDVELAAFPASSPYADAPPDPIPEPSSKLVALIFPPKMVTSLTHESAFRYASES
jgi:hypothetical protein